MRSTPRATEGPHGGQRAGRPVNKQGAQQGEKVRSQTELD